MNELEKVLKALANKRRLAVLKYLKSYREATVGEIAGEIKISFSATSKHLGILAALDIVEKEKRGLEIFYRLGRRQKPVAQYTISLL